MTRSVPRIFPKLSEVWVVDWGETWRFMKAVVNILAKLTSAIQKAGLLYLNEDIFNESLMGSSTELSWNDHPPQ